MTLVNLYNKCVIVSRMVALSKGKFEFSTITAEYVGIHRMSNTKTVDVGGSIGKTYRLYCEIDADIEIGDKLVDLDSNSYKVIAVTLPAALGVFEHLEAIIEKTNN